MSGMEMVQMDAGLRPKADNSIRTRVVKHTHLDPASMTTLACLIPLGMRSLMTSRMIRDPMKVYSADEKYTHQLSASKTCFITNEGGIDASFLCGT